MNKWNKILRNIFGLSITLFFTISKNRKKIIYDILLKKSIGEGDYINTEKYSIKLNHKLSQKEIDDLFTNFVINNIDYRYFLEKLKNNFSKFSISKNTLDSQFEFILKNSNNKVSKFLYKEGARTNKIDLKKFLKDISKHDLNELSFLIENDNTMDVVIASLLNNEPRYLLDKLLPILKEKYKYLSQGSVNKLFFYFYKNYFDNRDKLEKFNIKPTQKTIDSMVMYFITTKEVKKILYSIYLGASERVISEAITFLSLKGQRSALHKLENYLLENSIKISITESDKRRCLEAI